jgi:stress-induced morphogen
MEEAELETLLEERIEDAAATVGSSRHPGEDDRHYAVEVVSPAFEGVSLVDRHQIVHDALDEVLIDEVHAIEVETYTPDERED